MEFNDFWVPYPRKEAKVKAENAWKRVPKKEHEKIKADLETRQWPEKQYIPLPATYLNGKRWLDESTNVTKVIRESSIPKRVHVSAPRQGLTKTASQYLENLKKLYGRSPDTTEKG